jgi:hypothetical protein
LLLLGSGLKALQVDRFLKSSLLFATVYTEG